MLHERLRRLDPPSGERIHPGDLFRIVRALELLEITGRRPSELRPALWDSPRVAVSALIVLTREREELYRLIDERARRMWEGGLVEEVRSLLAAGGRPELPALRSLGYRQAVAFLAGRLRAVEALEQMQRATRNYARRQIAWFRREPAAEWIPVRGWDWVEPLAEKILARMGHQEAPRDSRTTNVG
jgi:tRNA dimethylallyltransferase